MSRAAAFRSAALAFVLIGLLAALTLWDIYGAPPMKRFLRVAVLALACLPASACITPAGRGIVAKLPDYEIRHAPAIPCSDFLARIDPEQQLSNSQQRAAVKVCEEMTKGVTVNPREVLESMRQSVPGPF